MASGRLWLNDGSCVRLRPERPNHIWSYDFVQDRTADGRVYRTLNIIDEYTREALMIRVGRKLNSTDVLDALTDLFILRGSLAFIRSDNGPEFIAQKVRDWIAAVGAKTAHIEPGSPWENGYCESFKARFRDELLNGEIFYSLREAQILIEQWRVHDNTVRPHSALGYRPPAPQSIVPTVQRPTMRQQLNRTTRWGHAMGHVVRSAGGSSRHSRKVADDRTQRLAGPRWLARDGVGLHDAVYDLGHRLLGALALELGVDPEELRQHITCPTSQLRMMRYLDNDQPASEDRVGIASHSDFECFTILLQGGPGLQVMNADYHWVEAPPIPGTFIVNIGDIFETWSGGNLNRPSIAS